MTPVSVTLPAAADNQATLEIRIITTNATGNDEWVGIDDIVVTSQPPGNNPPTITSNGGGATASISVAENMTAVTTVTATDPDAGDVITYSVSGTDASFFTINSSTGVLTFTVAPDFENPLDSGKNNVYDITVKATDTSNAFDSQDIAVTVTNVNDNAPVITSNGGGATAMVSVVENTVAVTTVTATDADGGTLTYSLSGGADKAKFAINASSGVLTFIAAPNFEGPTDADGNNKYEVTVQVSDSVNTDTQDITVTVTDDPNESPPVITSNGGGATAAIDLLENMTMVTTVTATDPDPASNITFSISGGLDAKRFAIDTNTGILTFLVAPNFEAPTDSNTDNKYEVTVKAFDGVFFDTQAITVTIMDVDEAPVFISDGGTPTTISRFENVLPVTTAMAVDPEGKTPITYGVAGGADAALFFLDGSNGQLSFLTAPNFEIPGDFDGDNKYEIILSATEGTTTGFQMLTVMIGNVNEAPTFTIGADQTVNEDAGSQTVPGFNTAITVGPAGDLGTKVNFTVSNDNSALFDVQPAIDSTGQLTYKAAANAFGTAKVAVFAMDNGGTDNGGVDTSATQFFTITVNSVNDAPDFSILGDQVVNEDSGAKSITGFLSGLTVGPANESAQTATVTTTNDKNALFLVQPSIDGTGKLTFTPASNANGVATVTVKVQDNGGTSFGGADTKTRTFTITVNAVNDAPSFIVGANQSVNEDDGFKAVPGFATAIAAGPADESGQMVSFLVSNDNMALFVSQPAIDASGKLTYTLANNAFGSAKVTVLAKDDGGVAFGGVDTSAAQFFTITVAAINDPPTFTIGADQFLNEDAGPITVMNYVTSISPGPANESSQSTTVFVSNDNNALFAVQPNVDAAGVLRFTPADNANGTAFVTISVMDDGGTANGGMDKSSLVLQVTISAVNDAPTYTLSGNTSTTINTGLQTVPGFLTAISPGPADESGQMVSFLVSNDNMALFAVQPSIDANGQLTYTPATDATGVATVTIIAMDDGGIALGGDDTADPQMFTITVFGKNVAPSFVVGADQTAIEDSGTTTVPGFLTSISVGPSIESGQTISFLVSNDNAALFTTAPAIDATGQLTYTLAKDAFGIATVTVIAMDDGGILNGGDDTSDPQTFTLTVSNRNDAPSFTVGGKQAVNEDAGAQSVSGFLTGIAAGPANESAQTIQFIVTTDNPSLFTVAPAIDANGKLTYTTAKDAFGTANVTVTAKDDGGTDFGGTDTSAPQLFTISVTPVNDAPNFTLGGDLVLNEDAGPQAVAFLSNLQAGPANESQTVAVTASSTNLGLFAIAPVIDASGKLTYTPAANANGQSVVTVTAKDNGGTANGGSDTTVQTFTITVNPVNDDPTFAINSKLVLNEDAGPQSIPGFAFAISAGPADEAAQPLNFVLTPVVTSGDLAFSQAPTLDATGTLAFTVAPDSFGTATVGVTLNDGNGGSSTQTFVLTVNPVNDPPTSKLLIAEAPPGGIGPQSVPGVLALSTGAGNENDVLVASVSIASTTGNISFTQAPAIDANGTLTYTASRNSIGTAKLAITVSDGTDATAVQFVTVSVDSTGPVETVGYPEFAVGSDFGLTYVSFHNPDQSERFFSPAFPGTEFGARVAGADFSRDGIADLVIGSGVGRSTLVQVIDAVTQKALFSIMPFEDSFTGGVYVAAGDVNGDGLADLIITPDEGGGPRVRVFNGADFTLMADFFGIDDVNFRGGARAAVGDLNADGKADLVVAAGFGGGPRIAGYDGAALAGGKFVKLFNDFFAFEQTLRNGVFIAVGDLDGDGRAEIIAGGGPGGGPRVTAFNGSTLLASSGATLTPVVNFFAGDTTSRGGIRIAVKDLDGDNKADIVVGAGTGAGNRVTAYLGSALAASPNNPAAAFNFDAFDDFTGGVFVG